MKVDSDMFTRLLGQSAVKPRASFERRILCIDDNRDLADTVVMLLDYGGYNVKACYDGFEGVREAIEFCPHVCLIDINMPGMNGFDVAHMIVRHFGGNSPRLFAVTAIDNERLRRKAKLVGFDDYLVKPVLPDDLLDLVAT